MSRIGRKPIAIPAGVEVKVDGNNVTVKGAKGTLTKSFHPNMEIKVEGVSKGFSKELDVIGVGYRVQKQGKNLVMNLGFSHQVIMPEVPGITIDCPTANKIVISGPDKQQVGQFAAEVREKRPPEPYKGKGIRYTGEYVRKKEGKTGKGKKK